nr:hypothetical protein BaRGS_017636 [Batillaria attramentaria]
MVEALLKKGAQVLFCDVNEAAGKATETELKQQFGDKVIFKLCDLTNSTQLSEVFQAAVSAFGAVDVCVNNAGIADESIWQTMIIVNMNAQIQGSFLAYEHMRKDKGGRGGVIINTASMSGFVFGSHRNPVYTATKHAMVAFTTCWANNPEMGAQGVRWGVLCPTAVQTNLLAMREGMIHDYEGWKKNLTPHDRLQPGDVAESFLALLENEDSNGAVLKVAREDGRAFHQLLFMDNSTNPPMGFVEQEKVFLASK